MSRQGVASSVTEVVADILLQSVQEEAGKDGRSRQQVREKLSNNGMEWQVVKFMQEDTIAVMQFLQPKALCIMLASFLATIYSHHEPGQLSVKPEPGGPS